MSQPSRLLTVDEAAELLNCSAAFIRKAIRRGDLPSYRFEGSRVLRIREADIMARLVLDNPAAVSTRGGTA